MVRLIQITTANRRITTHCGHLDWEDERKNEWSHTQFYTQLIYIAPLCFTMPTKNWKTILESSQEILKLLFWLSALSCPNGPNRRITFQKVAYAQTVYKTGISPWDFTSSTTIIFSDNFFVFVWKKRTRNWLFYKSVKEGNRWWTTTSFVANFPLE